MKLFDRSTFRVIFLAPVALYASQNGGCSQTSVEAGPLTAQQIQQTLVGNTVQLKGEKAIAFVAEDGTLRGRDIASGGTVGTWKVSDNGVLCARWTDVEGSPENCDALRYQGGTDYTWGGNTLQIAKGNVGGL